MTFLRTHWNKITAAAVLTSALAFGGLQLYKYFDGACCSSQASCCNTHASCCNRHVAQR